MKRRSRSKTKKYSRSTNNKRAGWKWGDPERPQTYDKFYQKTLENFRELQTDSAVSICSSENEEPVGVLLLTSEVDRQEEDKTEG